MIGLFGGLTAGVAGIRVLALGVIFNHLVSLFHQQPIQQGLFGKTALTQYLSNHFGLIGLISLIVGLLIGITSAILGINGWEITRLWLA